MVRRYDAGRDGVSTVKFPIAGPILVGFGFGLSMVMLLQAITVLSGWSTVYDGRGQFTVESCSVEPGRMTGTLECSGLLVRQTNPEPVSSTLFGSQAAFGSTTPDSGTVVETYYRLGDTTRAYPVDGRTVMLARILIGLVPHLFLIGGSALWLLGCLLTGNVAKEDAELGPFGSRFPQQFGLRARGRMWIVVGLLWWLFDRMAVDQLLGTAPLA